MTWPIVSLIIQVLLIGWIIVLIWFLIRAINTCWPPRWWTRRQRQKATMGYQPLITRLPPTESIDEIRARFGFPPLPLGVGKNPPIGGSNVMPPRPNVMPPRPSDGFILIKNNPKLSVQQIKDQLKEEFEKTINEELQRLNTSGRVRAITITPPQSPSDDTPDPPKTDPNPFRRVRWL